MSKIDFNGDAVRKLAEILVDTDLTEIEYEENGRRIYVSRRAQSVSQVASMPAAHHHVPSQTMVQNNAAPLPAANTKADFSAHPGALKSPMVGTAYLSPEPSAPSFVKVGDSVTAGQTLLIVEAMKVMNPIKAPSGGTITHILVSDASPVEFDQPLMIIE